MGGPWQGSPSPSTWLVSTVGGAGNTPSGQASGNVSGTGGRPALPLRALLARGKGYCSGRRPPAGGCGCRSCGSVTGAHSPGKRVRPPVSAQAWGCVTPPSPPGVLRGSQPLLSAGHPAAAWPGAAGTGLAPSAGAQCPGNGRSAALLGVSVVADGSVTEVEATWVASPRTLCSTRRVGVGRAPRESWHALSP